MLFRSFSAFEEVHANGDIFHHEQRQKDAHDDQIRQHSTRKSGEANEQKRHEDGERKREQIQLRNVFLPTEHGDGLVEEVDYSRYTGSL